MKRSREERADYSLYENDRRNMQHIREIRNYRPEEVCIVEINRLPNPDLDPKLISSFAVFLPLYYDGKVSLDEFADCMGMSADLLKACLCILEMGLAA